jgi:hypothetical protein
MKLLVEDDEGIVITGRLIGANHNKLSFADDLAATVAAGDAFVALIKARIHAYTEASSNHVDREQQFDYIQVQRAVFTAADLPILSVDTKKKELVGNLKNAGQVWPREPTAVNVHDYPHDELGRAVPYGVHDVSNNRGFVSIGTSGDTPAFAVDTLATWWQAEGETRFPGADHLLLLADAGGSNGCQIRAWEERLQVQICDRFGLTVTVCHYPTGCSKWNPIEHRLFSQIGRNWAGAPLYSWDTLLAFIRGTATSTGQVAHAEFKPGNYPTGVKVSDAEMKALSIEHHIICPRWNYTIRPRTPVPRSTEFRELNL